MCIRDRDQAAVEIKRIYSTLINKIELKEFESNINSWGYMPVSYTHLRAHETVLDLVCRLLLEKKKYTHKQHLLNTIKSIEKITTINK
mgnify:CR=1 FL=1